MRPLVLASTSPYRRQLLERLGLAFTVATPDCDERPRAGESAPALVERLAAAKARSVAGQHPDALVIGSDQVAALDGRILTKPGGHDRAVEQLGACSGRSVVFHTGLCLHDPRNDRARVERVDYTVHFRKL
ncbi:MAG: Maf family protein, partial [Halofilum sp. (in: g-proteobacteria)]|nr:Maf family protein [Halofilum sp. (in: g-proteobacteria)]